MINTANETDTTPARMPIVPAVIRGQIVESRLIEFGGRNDEVRFLAPEPKSLLGRLALKDPSQLSDLHALSTSAIIDVLIELGRALRFDENPHLQQALRQTVAAAPTTLPILTHQYHRISSLFTEPELRDIVASIGGDYLDGWVKERSREGVERYVRAFGSRALHIVAGNSPILGAVTLIRNALTRSDAIIKVPSNDPYTTSAIVRTLAEVAPGHPLTKHVSVAYWKGGDAEFEKQLYHPRNLDKIVAWGGLSSVKHVTQYIQPGLELLSLDPKRSISFIGAEAFESPERLNEAATRLAADIGANNQEACSNSRIAYVACGLDGTAHGRLVDFAQRVYEALLLLPERMSTYPKQGINRRLRAYLSAAEMNDDWYCVIGGRNDEGAIVVSRLPEPVDFATELTNRVANLVPVDSPADVYPRVDAYCQTVGIYPESLIAQTRDLFALAGAQRIVSLGFAVASPNGFGGPQDGLDVTNRLCKWICCDQCDPGITTPAWRQN